MQDSEELTLFNVPILLINLAKWSNTLCNCIKIETLAQVFSCGFSKISLNTFFYRTPPVAASATNGDQVQIFLETKTSILEWHIYRRNL